VYFYGGVTIEQSNSQFTVTGVEEEGGDGSLDLSLFSGKQLVVLLVTAFPSQALCQPGVMVGRQSSNVHWLQRKLSGKARSRNREKHFRGLR